MYVCHKEGNEVGINDCSKCERFPQLNVDRLEFFWVVVMDLICFSHYHQLLLFAAAPEAQQNNPNYSSRSKYSRAVTRKRWDNCKGKFFKRFTRSSRNCFPFSLPLLASSSSHPPWRLLSTRWLIIRPAVRTIIRFRRRVAPFIFTCWYPISCHAIYFGPNCILNRCIVCLPLRTGYLDKQHCCNLAQKWWNNKINFWSICLFIDQHN